MRGLYLLLLLGFIFTGCDSQSNMSTEASHSDSARKSNGLAGQTSPYLLQHQYNPVDWQPWAEEAFAKAKAENKLVLISVGYSSCHWCHVMEHESFEDDSVAQVMNEHFVSIKVDREERPDVDQVYMNAVQLMTGRGGWPLNCFALPDGRPIYGGTYYKREDWLSLLDQLHTAWRDDPQQVKDYAEQLTNGIQESSLVKLNASEADFDQSILDETVKTWKTRLDNREGGPNRSPKFPLPNNYLFLHRYAHLAGDEELVEHVYLTLDKMAQGGIYDQIGGGFARYSVDGIWKVPHFEKMLYDNAQLISLYSEAYQATKNDAYAQVVYETYRWLETEMRSSEGMYYSALDADSEGEEGKFYIWTKAELQEVLGEDYDFAAELYNVNAKGRWEDEHYILLRDESDKDFMAREGMDLAEFKATQERVREKLMERRATRIRPGLDDKVLSSWNALLVTGLCDAGMAFTDQSLIDRAEALGQTLWDKLQREDGGLYHTYQKGQPSINGYLEDYSFLAQAYISLYQVSFDEKWLERSKRLVEYAIAHFSEEETDMFYFTSDLDPPLVARKMEIDDNVIPASNSSMALALHHLGTYYFNEDWLARSKTMLNNMVGEIPSYGGGYSNWSNLMLHHVFPYYEVALMDAEPEALAMALNTAYKPNKLLMGGRDDTSNLPLLEFKHVPGETMIYVCVERACQLPVGSAAEALQQMD